MRKNITILCFSLLVTMGMQAQKQNNWGKVLNQSNHMVKTSEKEEMIAVELPQLIYVNDNDIKYYATRMNFEIIDGNNQYVKDPKSQTIKFVWRNDSLIKTENDVLIGMTSTDGDWNGIGDLVSSSDYA